MSGAIPTRDLRAGVVLVLVSAIAVALLSLAVVFLQMSRMGGRTAASRMSQTRAGLATASGMDYAAARLSENPYPAGSGAAARGDDWTFRDGAAVALPDALNPSYSHGEAWRDGAWGTDGVYERGIDAGLRDLDGDGQLDAWCARLRGGRGAHDLRISLKIESSSGKIPVNAGYLDAGNRNGGSPAVPDHKDLAFVYHKGLAHALNNLGALVLPAGHARRWEIPTANPRETIRYSVLGNDLIGSRPAGGYRTREQMKAVLLSLGTYPVDPDGDPDGLDEILPYVDLGPADSTPQAGPPWTHAVADQSTYVPASYVEFIGASPVVLQALWRYLACPMDERWGPAFAAAGSASYDPRAGPAGLQYYFLGLILYPDEVERLTGFAVDYRRSSLPRPSWRGLYAHLLRNAESADEVYGPEPGDGKIVRSSDPDPLYGLEAYPMRARYAAAKVDLAMAAAVPFPHPFPFAFTPAWSGWGLPRDAGSGVERPYVSQAWWRHIGRVNVPSPEPEGSYVSPNPFWAAPDPIAPLAMTLRAPARFSVETLVRRGEGGTSRMSGTLRVADLLELSSQEDFENATAGADLSPVGISAVNDPWTLDAAGRRRGFSDDPVTGKRYRHVSSLPRWDTGSYPPSPPGAAPLYPGYPRLYGALALASREAGPRGADFYWAFGETDDDTPAGFYSESDTGKPSLPWMGYAFALPLLPLNPNRGVLFLSNLPWAAAFTPHGVSTHTSAAYPPMVFQESADPSRTFPGMANGTVLSAFTIAGWVSPGQLTAFNQPSPDSYSARFVLATPLPVPLAPSLGTLEFRALIISSVTDPGVRFRTVLNGSTVIQWDLPDGDESSHQHHFAVVFRPVAAGKSSIEMYIDGVIRGSSTVLGTFTSGLDEKLHVGMLDELRLYGNARAAGDILGDYQAGRFVKRGTYASPRYVCGGPASLRRCQWMGLTPPSYKDAAGSPVDPFTVGVEAYWDDAGTAPAWSGTLTGGSEAVEDLYVLGCPGRIRSFRYLMTFDAGAVEGPIRDTPVFESIWFTLQRKGTAPAWTVWESR